MFWEAGPEKCSGFEIRQYNAETLQSVLGPGFELKHCLECQHM